MPLVTFILKFVFCTHYHNTFVYCVHVYGLYLPDHLKPNYVLKRASTLLPSPTLIDLISLKVVMTIQRHNREIKMPQKADLFTYVCLHVGMYVYTVEPLYNGYHWDQRF